MWLHQNKKIQKKIQLVRCRTKFKNIVKPEAKNVDILIS